MRIKSRERMDSGDETTVGGGSRNIRDLKCGATNHRVEKSEGLLELCCMDVWQGNEVFTPAPD
jgi:hypothetical protein